MFFQVLRNSSNKRRIVCAALIRGRRLVTLLQMRRLCEGGAYSSKYGICLLGSEEEQGNRENGGMN